jgi:hypothetical protein
VQVNGLIAQMEEDEKGYSHRKEYVALDKQVQSLQVTLSLSLTISQQLATAKRNFDSLSEEYDIAMLDPKDAHSKFVARVNEHKQVRSSPSLRLILLVSS